MPTGIKALVIILVFALGTFAVAKPVCLRYMDEASFRRRRNVWFALTILVFVCPSFWVYAVIAMPLMYLAAKRDDNPLAFYALLLFVIPNVSFDLPTFGGIGQFFALNHDRMLSLVVLLPLLFRRRELQPNVSAAFTSMDWAVAAYCLLQIALFAPYESPTNTLRRSLLLFLDTFIVFYTFARIPPTRQAMIEVVVCLTTGFGIMAGLAVFESARGWLLYGSIPETWGSSIGMLYLQRGDSLRAQVTSGHSLTLGYLMGLGIGFWLFLQSLQGRSRLNSMILLVFCAGLLVSYSRGAWLSAAMVVAIYLSLQPGAAKLWAKVVPAIAVLAVIAYLSPLKEALIDRLPFIGTADQDTVEYRRRLFEVSWQLIKLKPVFGDPFVTNQMEELRQGQGIIDIVNAYIAVALFSGFVGLTLFVSVFVIATWRCYTAMRICLSEDPQMALLGVSLLGCMLASLFFMATAGVGGIEYLLTGLLASFARVAGRKTAASSPLPAGAMAFGRTRM